ncbi:MAG: PEP-CTERM sorting domain-containing protein [Gemmatimonadaceae bacterium]|nr:PEP-CTERM sorting domain-containing protein [Gemmatimonadaceae bacterium]
MLRRATAFLMLGVASLGVLPTAAVAQMRTVTVTVTNLANPNSVSFAPLHLGFHRGVFDAFNIGTTAAPGIVSVAEGGAGGQWQSDFAAADPTANRGTIGGALLPGQTRSQSFVVNAGLNQFFSFASMVIPSNDFFIGNDNPTGFRLFDSAGNLMLSSITQTSSQIWDAGSEAFSVAGAAFLVNGVNDVRTPQNGTVGFNFDELMRFDGEMTAAGYVFTSGLASNQPIYRIDFTSVAVVPEPATVVLFGSGLVLLGGVARRRRTA